MRSFTAIKNFATTTILVFMIMFSVFHFTNYLSGTRTVDVRDSQQQTGNDLLEGAFVQGRRRVLHQQDFEPMILKTTRNSSFDYEAAMKKLNDEKVAQDDPRLIRIIRDYFIEPPSREEYNLQNSERLEYSNGQTPFVDSRLNYTEGGFYIECGALNGEKGSNSLFFEKVRKWNGLLVEADPDNYRDLKSKNRKAFSINACLNTQPYPSKMTFNKAFNLGHIVHESDDAVNRHHVKKKHVEIQCFPLYSLLLALNQLTVDFFSLDVEGDELSVLKTIPWGQVNIKMLTVEYSHVSGSSHGLTNYMKQQGYEALLDVSRSDWGVKDIIYRKKGLTH